MEEEGSEQGFGTELLRVALHGLDATVERAWHGSDRVVTITVPQAKLAL